MEAGGGGGGGGFVSTIMSNVDDFTFSLDNEANLATFCTDVTFDDVTVDTVDT